MRKIQTVVAFIVITLALLMALAPVGQPVAQAQTASTGWSTPINLSHSGAANSPEVVAASDGRIQVFWWDKIDGLYSANYVNKKWSDSFAIGVRFPQFTSMPTILADNSGWVHAFWNKSDGGPLMHAKMRIGSTEWNPPTVVAESDIAFDVTPNSAGGVTLLYIRTKHTQDVPSGIYMQRTDGNGGGWVGLQSVFPSIYYRLIGLENAYVRVAEDGGILHITFYDPHYGRYYYTQSANNGVSWTEGIEIGEGSGRVNHPRVAPTGKGEGLLIWEAPGVGGCTLYQQPISSIKPSSKPLNSASPSATPRPSNANLPASAVQVLIGINTCPTNDTFTTLDKNLIWTWGQTTSTLTTAGWDPSLSRWSEPKNISFSFQDGETKRNLILSDLHMAMIGKTMVVVGKDGNPGEIWVTTGEMLPLEFTSAPPSPWSAPAQFTVDPNHLSLPSIVLDSQGHANAVWSSGGKGDSPDQILNFSRYDGTSWQKPVVVHTSAVGEFARSPKLLAGPQDLLHLVWSGSNRGQILYRRAKLDQAITASGWASETILFGDYAASMPQIQADLAGNLYVVFLVPLNEKRGIYLVSSTDAGQNWSAPELIFDAIKNNWDMVDELTFAITPDGKLHVAWVQGPLPGVGGSQGIDYLQSADQGKTWSSLQTIAGPGYENPELIVASGQLHIFYNEVQTGKLWTRFADARTDEYPAWSPAATIANLQNVTVPPALTVDGQGTGTGSRLHLVTTDAGAGKLIYTYWDGSKWNPVESIGILASTTAISNAAAITLPDNSKLLVLLQADVIGKENPQSVPGLLSYTRILSSVSVTQLPTLQPTAVLTNTPTATVLPSPTPKPTLDFNTIPDKKTLAVSPFIIGGLLAVVIIIAALFIRSAIKKR